MIDPRRARLAHIATIILLLILSTGCATMTSTPAPTDKTSHSDNTNYPARWPLKFKAHYFDAYCFSTYGCKVIYRQMIRALHPDEELRTSLESLGGKYPGIMTAGMGPIRNFPPPAKVTWRSRDGTPLEAEVDTGEIFKDELIRHNLTLDEVTPAVLASDHAPGIVLEVNDRTINVYMRATLWLKKPRFPDRPHSNYQDDLIKVYSKTY